MRVWRVTHAKYRVNAFSGAGSASVDGRWHTRTVGVPLVYTSSSVSLAMMETLVNASRQALSRATFVQIPVDIPDEVAVYEVSSEDIEKKDKNWRNYAPYGTATQRIGNTWLIKGASVALKVPSALLGGADGVDFNVLLNPRHEDFARLTIGVPTPCPLDSRLFLR